MPLESLGALYTYIYIMYSINFLAVVDMNLNIAIPKPQQSIIMMNELLTQNLIQEALLMESSQGGCELFKHALAHGKQSVCSIVQTLRIQAVFCFGQINHRVPYEMNMLRPFL